MVLSCGTCNSSQTVESEYVSTQFAMAKRAVGKAFGCGESDEPWSIKSLLDEDFGLTGNGNEDTNSIDEKSITNLEIIDEQVEMTVSYAGADVNKDDDVRDGAEKDADETSVATESTLVLKKSVAKAVAKYVAKLTGSKKKNKKEAEQETKEATEDLSVGTNSVFEALAEARSKVLDEAGRPDFGESKEEAEEDTEGSKKEPDAEALSEEPKKEPVVDETSKELEPEETNKEPVIEESKDEKEEDKAVTKATSFQGSIKSSSSAKGCGNETMTSTQPIQAEEPKEEEPEPEAEPAVEVKEDTSSTFQELSIKSSPSDGDASVTSRLSELVHYRRLVQSGLESAARDVTPPIFDSPEAKEAPPMSETPAPAVSEALAPTDASPVKVTDEEVMKSEAEANVATEKEVVTGEGGGDESESKAAVGGESEEQAME